MNREVHVRFCEEQGVKSPLLTRLYVRASPRSVSPRIEGCVPCVGKQALLQGWLLCVGFVCLANVLALAWAI